MNGVPHLSIGDGWWAEGYNGQNGWLIDGQAPADDEDAVDAADADALYRLLESTRSCRRSTTRTRTASRAGGCSVVKEAIRTVAPRFCDAPDGEGIRRADVRCRPCGRSPR